jgi:hypothetical protein
VRCPRCGNENPDSHRYCGMCGASLLQGPGAAMATGQFAPEKTQSGAPATSASPGAPATAAAPGVAASAPPAATAAPRAPATPAPRSGSRPAEPVTGEPPAISGPSFLGLNQPAPTSSKRGRLSIDPDSHSGSRNLDYLLEDDEPKGGGWKIALMFIALVLAVGFGYLRWKNHGFPWLNAIKQPAAETTAPDSTATAGGTNSPNAPAGTPNPATAPSSPANSNAPAATGSAPPTGQPTGNAASAGSPNSSAGASSAPSATPANSPAIAPVTSPNATQESSPADNANAPANTAPASAPQNPVSATPPSTQPSSAASGTSDKTVGSASAPAGADTAQADEATKPPAAIKRVPAVDAVAQAQSYLYGKGVPQDCDRGLRMLKPAANSGNAKAMIEMGALYSAGLCTPRDLPTAYRWFAMALRKDPGNQSVATDLQKLWGEMTQPERQLAIRLSQ